MGHPLTYSTPTQTHFLIDGDASKPYYDNFLALEEFNNCTGGWEGDERKAG